MWNWKANPKLATDEKEKDDIASEVPQLSRARDDSEAAPFTHDKSDVAERSVVDIATWRKQKDPQHYSDATHMGVAMPDAPSRDEIAARLEAAEARTETRFAQLSGSLDLRFANLGQQIDQITTSINRLVSEVQEVKADNKTTRMTTIVTVIASVLAAIAAIWVTQGNLLAAFQASIALKPSIGAQAPTSPK